MKFTNKDQGARYLNTTEGPVVCMPGQTIEVELSSEELASAQKERCANSTRHRWGIDEEGDGERERLFIAVSDDSRGGGFQLVDLGNARFVGIFKGTAASSDPEDYHLQAIRTGDKDHFDDTVQEADGEAKPLSRMNKAELIDKAAEHGIEVPEGATNADIVKLIEAKQEG